MNNPGSRGLPALLFVPLLLIVSHRASATCYELSCSSSHCSGNLKVSNLISGSQFPPDANTPSGFVDPGDGSSRRLIPTQEGKILVWDGVSGSSLTTFLDLTAKVRCCGERGLLALAVDPQYASTGRLYVFYTGDGNDAPGANGDIVVERYLRKGSTPLEAEPNSATTILTLTHPASNHNGGWLAFGPDGFLYVSTGDGGGGCDSDAGASGDGQNRTTLHGKLLRLDVRGVDPAAGAPECGANQSYTVPTSNPYQGNDGSNFCGEIFDYGLRNPFRFSFDRLTGDIYIGDVGQNNWEEVNFHVAETAAPVNFGWVCREGCASSGIGNSQCNTNGCVSHTVNSCQYPTAGGHMDPILCHSNPNGWKSVMGGYVYRGQNVPGLGARYVYSDNQCGQIWVSDDVDTVGTPANFDASCWDSGHGGMFGFAEDSLGELYIVNGGAGRIDCIHNGAGCPWASGGIFADGFESGNTTSWSNTDP